MPYYRFYVLDASGHFDRVHEAMLDDDLAAEIEARRLDDRAPIEIWSQHRQVCILPVLPRRRRGG